MKQVCLFILLLISGVGYTQIKIDFEKKTIELPPKDTLKNRKEIQVIIEKIPMSAYKVSINKTDSFINAGTPPPLFSVLSFGDGFNSLLTGLTGYTISNAGNLVIPVTDAKKNKWNNINGLMETKEVSFDSLLQFACIGPVSRLNEKLKEMRNKVYEFHFDFRDKVIRKTDQLIYQHNLGKLTAEEFKSAADNIITERYNLEKELETKYKNYYDIILPDYTAVTKCIPLAAADSMLTSYKKSFFQFLNKYDTTFNESLIAKVYKQLNTKPVTSYTSLPYRLKADLTRFTIDISGIDPAKTPQSYNTVIELEKHPNRFWTFTSGVFVSKLINHEFSIRTNVQPNAQNPNKKDTLNYTILQESNNKVSAGINALMHIGGYFGENRDLGAYVAFGPGLTLEKTPQVRAFLGAGFMFGRTNKLALSFGWTGGLVKRLTTNYNLSETYDPAPIDITRDRFKGGGFISLGYSILGK